MNAKNLNKKIRRLVERIEKDTKKLAKLRLKLTTAGAKKKKPKKEKAPVAVAGPRKSSRPKRKKRRKLNISAARRAELSAAMKARWAAKRAGSKNAPPEASDGVQPS